MKPTTDSGRSGMTSHPNRHPACACGACKAAGFSAADAMIDHNADHRAGIEVGRAAERARIAEAVRGMRNPYRNHGGVMQGAAYGSGWEEARAAVLALLEPTDD
ncbi:MAG: hypothetical protein FIA92_13535 [Chloroflexi bacterium]|nr:hypothetical protein [Chloroflexota bacterium]